MSAAFAADDLRRAALEAGAIDAGELLDLADDVEAEDDRDLAEAATVADLHTDRAGSQG